MIQISILSYYFSRRVPDGRNSRERVDWWRIASHSSKARCSKRHCRPILIAGISPHSAQRRMLRGVTPRRPAMIAVERYLALGDEIEDALNSEVILMEDSSQTDRLFAK